MVDLFVSLHVLIALATVGPLIHGATTASRAIRQNDAPAARYTARLLRIYSIGSVVAVILGFGLMSMKENGERLGSLGQTWIWLSLLLWLVAVGLAFGLIAPALENAAEQIDGGGTAGSVTATVLSAGMAVAVLLSAIVFLMIYQPGH